MCKFIFVAFHKYIVSNIQMEQIWEGEEEEEQFELR